MGIRGEMKFYQGDQKFRKLNSENPEESEQFILFY
jgi:hypothetical protein